MAARTRRKGRQSASRTRGHRSKGRAVEGLSYTKSIRQAIAVHPGHRVFWRPRDTMCPRRAHTEASHIPCNIRCTVADSLSRPDTAASVTNLVRILHQVNKLPAELRVLDLCTGSGCIPLLFQHELSLRRPDIRTHPLGVDVSAKALRLAALNRQRLSKTIHAPSAGRLKLVQADVLLDPFADQDYEVPPLKNVLNYRTLPSFWDILISNPPYITPSGYWNTTMRSVRAFEPQLALVPPPRIGQNDVDQGDLFYPRLLEIARDVEAKIVLLEVADLAQAQRVAKRAQVLDIFDGIEIWRDDPASSATSSEDSPFDIVGEGIARSVLCWRGNGSSWLGKAARQDDAKRLFQSVQTSRDSLVPGFDLSNFKPVMNEDDAQALMDHVYTKRLPMPLRWNRRARSRHWFYGL